MADVIQRSPEWHALRLGKVTASRISDMVAKTKSGWGASRANYAAELVAERLTGRPAEAFRTAAMQWGTDTEPDARIAYEWHRDVTVSEVAFVLHPRIPQAGASPDGLVGDSGLVEIKCPNTATHIETLLGQAIPTKYVLQMQWQMACTDRRWCDFVSFDPRMPDALQIHVQRIFRDDEQIAELERETRIFLDEVAATLDRLRSTYGDAEALDTLAVG
ncbi:lambda exonuclease family protein [Chthonobacter rhizosphaerae]|uniref:lambda exonuclease family protein n=1 Tax=Chthonobacter rhizosphaerae TaxID=2735553 RepID=UPI0015EECF84|nr:lambda exonuclease family protein [Chthonobacter rhizosphaerae]